MKGKQPTLGELVDSARRRAFVGRKTELRALLDVMTNPGAGPRLHFVHGPGGIGKTALLDALQVRCEDLGAQVLRIDARDLGEEQSAGDLFGDLSRDSFVDSAVPHVALVDNFMPLASLESWLRRDVLPRLPAGLHIVVAGRKRPSATWTTALGWADLVDVTALRGFHRTESERFLAARGVDRQHHRPLHRATGGHPLALALAAESGATDNLEDLSQDVVSELVARFCEEVPTPLHYAALEAACTVRTLQARQLQKLLKVEDASELFDWLARLSFIENLRDGLRPHDLVRTVVGSQARARDPVGARKLHARARAWYLERLVELEHQPLGPGATQAMLGLAFLHGANRVGRNFLGWGQDETLRTVPATGPMVDFIASMVQRHQGDEAQRWFTYWAARQPDQVFACLGRGRDPVGMLQYVLLSNADREHAEVDPCTRAAFAWVDQHAPLRGGERILLTRFWMDAERHQAVGPVQTCLWIHTTVRYRLLDRLALGIAVFQDPDFWSTPFGYMDFHRAAEADFLQEGHTYGMFVHDWRVLPVRKWNRLIAERQLDPDAGPPPTRHVMVLAQDDFDDAVRAALRAFSRPTRLKDNPLLSAPLILNRVEPAADVSARARVLRDLLVETAESLEGSVRGDKLYRALTHTYFQTLGSQEDVAAHLDLAFTTYRRHLVAAVREVTAQLWAREIGEDLVEISSA